MRIMAWQATGGNHKNMGRRENYFFCKCPRKSTEIQVGINQIDLICRTNLDLHFRHKVAPKQCSEKWTTHTKTLGKKALVICFSILWTCISVDITWYHQILWPLAMRPVVPSCLMKHTKPMRHLQYSKPISMFDCSVTMFHGWITIFLD